MFILEGENGLKVLIFGIGAGTEVVEKTIQPGHEIIGYMDSFSEIKLYHDKPFYRLSEIKILNMTI